MNQASFNTTSKKFALGIIITGILAVIALVVIISAIVSFAHQTIFADPPLQLENFGYVYIEEGGTFQIFLEDSTPPFLGFLTVFGILFTKYMAFKKEKNTSKLKAAY